MSPAVIAARSRASQGLPERVVDPSILATIAVLLAGHQARAEEVVPCDAA